MYLKKETALFQRNESGQLLPIEVPLLALEKYKFEDGQKVLAEPAPLVKLIPVSRGRWLELMKLSDVEQDKIILKEFLVEPKIEEKEYSSIKPLMMSAITTALTALTLDIEQKTSVESQRKTLTEAEEWLLKKKSLTGNNEQSCSSTNLDTTTST